MDEQVGRIRETLRKAGVADNTMVTFCSDNGPEGNSSAPGSAGIYRGRKRDLYEGGVRVPGLIEWPAKIKAGTVTDYPAVTSDYLPTILEIVGTSQPAPRPIDGLSLLPVFDESAKTRPSPIGFNFGGRQALTDNRYKLVYYPGKKKARKKGKQGKKVGVEATPEKELADATPALRYQLYDLLEDPSESKDIAAAHPEVYKTMTATLEAWLASCKQSSQGQDYGTE
jgi:arylsulfatase A-like enzyme